MSEYYNLKESLKRELKELDRKGELSAGDLDVLHKAAGALKNLCKIEMYEEYSERGNSYDGGYDGGGGNSYRGHYVRGHYSNDGYGGGDGGSYRGGYSRGGSLRDKLERMMKESDSDRERDMLRQFMDQVGR